MSAATRAPRAQRVRQIVTDASHDPRLAAAGIAVSAVGQVYQVYRSEVVPAQTVQEAEGRAVLAGIDYMVGRNWSAGSVILSDSLDLIRAVYGEVPAEVAKVTPHTLDLIRQKLDQRGFVLRKGERKEVHAAHRGALAALRAYRAGATLGGGPEASARAIAGAVLARIKAVSADWGASSDLAFEVAVALENYASDGGEA